MALPFKQAWPRSRILSTALQAIALVALAVLAWVPTAQDLAQPSADQVWEQFGIGASCGTARFDLGWLGDGGGAVSGSGSVFGGAQLMGWLNWISCQLSLATGISPLQGFLIAGLSLTFVLSALACRWGASAMTPACWRAFCSPQPPLRFPGWGTSL